VCTGSTRGRFRACDGDRFGSYRNLALHRPAYQSSSCDYNLTAQLVTTALRRRRCPLGLGLRQREWHVEEGGSRVGPGSQSHLRNRSARREAVGRARGGGGGVPPEVDRVELFARVESFGPAGWTCTVLRSNDERTWKELGRTAGTDRPGRQFRTSVAFTAPSRSRFYRRGVRGSQRAGGPRHRGGAVRMGTSAWRSAGRTIQQRLDERGLGRGMGVRWIWVRRCIFDRVALYWIRRAAEGSIQISDDATTWATFGAAGDQRAHRRSQACKPAQARYVRVLMRRPASPKVTS